MGAEDKGFHHKVEGELNSLKNEVYKSVMSIVTSLESAEGKFPDIELDQKSREILTLISNAKERALYLKGYGR